MEHAIQDSCIKILFTYPVPRFENEYTNRASSPAVSGAGPRRVSVTSLPSSAGADGQPPRDAGGQAQAPHCWDEQSERWRTCVFNEFGSTA